VNIDTACKAADVDCELRIIVDFYDEARELAGKRCPYKGDRSARLRELLDERTYADAVEILDSLECKYRVINYIESNDAREVDEHIHQVGISKTRNVFYVNLTVRRPQRADFTVSIAPRPHSDYDLHKSRVDDFERELDPGDDGKLTRAAKNPGVLTVLVNESATGRAMKNILIELVRNPKGQDARRIAAVETDELAAATFTITDMDWVGDLEVNVRIKRKRNQADFVEETLRGWITVPVVERSANEQTTMSGRDFRRKDGVWTRADFKKERLEAEAKALKELALWKEAQSCRTAAASGIASDDLVKRCWEQGIVVVRSSSGGTSTGDGRASLVSAVGYIVNALGLAQAKIAAAGVPGNRAVLGSALLGPPAASSAAGGVGAVSLIPGSTLGIGGNLIGDASSGLVSKVKGISLADANGIISDNGSGFISDHGAGLIGLDGGTLIGLDGGTLIGLDGGTR
jgi:hypothetical protein